MNKTVRFNCLLHILEDDTWVYHHKSPYTIAYTTTLIIVANIIKSNLHKSIYVYIKPKGCFCMFRKKMNKYSLKKWKKDVS